MVSIIIAAYNAEKYIKECLDSIINQTYKNLQIIVVNDGSTDSTLSICQQYKDKRIEIITKKNGGLSSARNEGLTHVRGEFVYFVDSDDVISPNAIEVMLDLINSSNSDIAVSGYEKFVTSYSNDDRYNKNETKIYTSKSYLEEILSLQKNTYAWATLIKAKYIEKLVFPENHYYEDLATMYLLFVEAGKIAYTPTKLLKYRQNPTSIVHTYKKEKVEDYVNYGIKMCDYIEKRYPNLYKKCNTYKCYIYIAAYSMQLGAPKKEHVSYDSELLKYRRKIEISSLPRAIKIKILAFKYSIPFGKLLLKLKRRASSCKNA